jgi:hypothetical protein
MDNPYSRRRAAFIRAHRGVRPALERYEAARADVSNRLLSREQRQEARVAASLAFFEMSAAARKDLRRYGLL